MEQPCVNVLWMYPDSLHLHGDRGNLMALQRVGALLGISVRIRRLERPGQTLPLDWADLLLFDPAKVHASADYVNPTAIADTTVRAIAATLTAIAKRERGGRGGSSTGSGTVRARPAWPWCRQR